MKGKVIMPFVVQSGRVYKRGEIIECKAGEFPAYLVEEIKEAPKKRTKKNADNS